MRTLPSFAKPLSMSTALTVLILLGSSATVLAQAANEQPAVPAPATVAAPAAPAAPPPEPAAPPVPAQPVQQPVVTAVPAATTAPAGNAVAEPPKPAIEA